jgi:carbon storage regulator CsrA
MLVLTRKSGEAISIDGISITVRVGSSGRVILAIDAPENIRIRRSEVLDVDADDGQTKCPANPSTTY